MLRGHISPGLTMWVQEKFEPAVALVEQQME